jgi:hypothetical protein
MSDNEQWDEEGVADVLLNPIHTMGSKPTIDRKLWIGAQKKLIKDLGEDAYFERLLATIDSAFGDYVE